MKWKFNSEIASFIYKKRGTILKRSSVVHFLFFSNLGTNTIFYIKNDKKKRINLDFYQGKKQWFSGVTFL